MPKIVQYKLPPGGTVVELADNQIAALDVQGSDGKDYLIINTVDGSEQMELGSGSGTSDVCKVSVGSNPGTVGEVFRVRQSYTADSLALIENTGAGSALDVSSGTSSASVDVMTVKNGSGTIAAFNAAGQTKLTGLGGASGNTAPATGGATPTLVLDSGTANSGNRTTLYMNSSASGGSQIDMYQAGDRKLLILAQASEQVIVAEDTLIIRSESNDATRVSVGASSFNVQDLATIHAKNSADAVGASYEFRKSRHAGDGSHTVVQDNDVLGEIEFSGSDGDSYAAGAEIFARVNGTPGDGSMPTELVFSTTGAGTETASERVYIRQNGNVGINDSAPNYQLANVGTKSVPLTLSSNSSTSAIGTTYTSLPNGSAAALFDHRVGDSIYLQNNTAENTADGRETGIGFFGRVDLSTDEYHYQGAIRCKHEGSAADQKGYLQFLTNDGNDNRDIQERMRIDSAGNIGMGTNAPGAQLEIKGALAKALTGTFTATNGSTAISSGSSTAFLTELAVGSPIKIGTETFTVTAIASDTALTLDSAFAGSTASGLSGTTDEDYFKVQTNDGGTKFLINNNMSGRVEIDSVSQARARLIVYDQSGAVGPYLQKINGGGAFVGWDNDTTFGLTTDTGNSHIQCGASGGATTLYKNVQARNDFCISTNHSDANGVNVLLIENGTAPSGNLSNSIQMYSESGELKVRDAAGNVTVLSPHNFEMLEERSEPMAWSAYSQNVFVGKEINVDMLRVIRKLEELTGESFVTMRDLPADQCKDWDTEEQRHVDERNAKIAAWDNATEEERAGTSRPVEYTARPKPDWLN
jgi:hypothetical protein